MQRGLSLTKRGGLILFGAFAILGLSAMLSVIVEMEAIANSGGTLAAYVAMIGFAFLGLGFFHLRHTQPPHDKRTYAHDLARRLGLPSIAYMAYAFWHPLLELYVPVYVVSVLAIPVTTIMVLHLYALQSRFRAIDRSLGSPHDKSLTSSRNCCLLMLGLCIVMFIAPDSSDEPTLPMVSPLLVGFLIVSYSALGWKLAKSIREFEQASPTPLAA